MGAEGKSNTKDLPKMQELEVERIKKE